MKWTVITLIILCDTRQKIDKNADIDQQLTELGCNLIRNKLYVGDYCRIDNMLTCVDTKQDIQELASNLTHDHERFRAECERAKEAGIKLVILIADEKVTDLKSLCGWYNYRRKFNKAAPTGRQLSKICHTMQDRYGVEFKFAKRCDTGKEILSILGG